MPERDFFHQTDSLSSKLKPLSDYIRQLDDFCAGDVILLGLNILNALRIFHRSGIAYGNIDIHHIYVTDQGYYRLEGLDQTAKTGTRFAADAAADLRHLGNILYQLLNAGQVFDDTESQPLKDVVMKAVSASESFHSADEFMNALSSAEANTPENVLDKEIVPDPGLFAHADTKPDVKVFSTRAEACAAVQEIRNMLKNLKRRQKTAALNSLIYTVKCIEEKLSIGSEFKGGSPQILDCEHQVMQNLQRLYGNAEILKTAYDLELAEEMEDTAADIISLLRQRSLLKRK